MSSFKSSRDIQKKEGGPDSLLRYFEIIPTTWNLQMNNQELDDLDVLFLTVTRKK